MLLVHLFNLEKSTQEVPVTRMSTPVGMGTLFPYAVVLNKYLVSLYVQCRTVIVRRFNGGGNPFNSNRNKFNRNRNQFNSNRNQFNSNKIKLLTLPYFQ